MAQILDGKKTAAEIRGALSERARAFTERAGRAPSLAVVLVEGDPASEIYVRNKERACKETGIISRLVRLPADVPEQHLLNSIRTLNDDGSVDGILVQLPLPAHIDAQKVLLALDPHKDVDGFHPENAGLLFTGAPRVRACTPRAVMELIRRTGVALAGKHAVVVGRSNIVGKPLALLLLEENATVTVCHSHTEQLERICREADVLISAAGRPGLITREHVKPGAVVIDVGINRTKDGLRGDVDFDAASSEAAWITPVPGGVGPMTIAMLLENTLELCGA